MSGGKRPEDLRSAMEVPGYDRNSKLKHAKTAGSSWSLPV